ncbi:hypothetical protein [Variovorax boronicumulans]|uniref:hypothetical protein n=1 Tax=Variovorax boronicumulans TaxID=436515 RepID=UPI003392DA7D
MKQSNLLIVEQSMACCRAKKIIALVQTRELHCTGEIFALKSAFFGSAICYKA